MKPRHIALLSYVLGTSSLFLVCSACSLAKEPPQYSFEETLHLAPIVLYVKDIKHVTSDSSYDPEDNYFLLEVTDYNDHLIFSYSRGRVVNFEQNYFYFFVNLWYDDIVNVTRRAQYTKFFLKKRRRVCVIYPKITLNL